ncbi:hypothetical protein RJ639_041319 [Escallonia herrerae]|uniref:4Fe-4S ferredoxin-type domain-containing protein n=1 Tax=Escallonia herrerae TaxID=1293975 RepID=A0AA88WF76_9ASTE|nr:hypothetical protein RJ639_041319 [Escallonia herrerae]
MEKVSEGCLANEDEDGYDAVVVGSGYGGSVTACRMSMAGIKVCLLERGRRWEAEDFPTDSLKMLSTFRIENRNLGIGFGPSDALIQVIPSSLPIYDEAIALYKIQVNIQGDSLSAIACGLGGGSLVNAGVMKPTPVRAKRNPKWPKEWEGGWEICEASASAMLRIQTVPTKFPNAKVMDEVAGEESEETNQTSVKLSINFDVEEQKSNSRKTREPGSCLACGNCLSGCPYNAKNSTDKNYLVSAIQVRYPSEY